MLFLEGQTVVWIIAPSYFSGEPVEHAVYLARAAAKALENTLQQHFLLAHWQEDGSLPPCIAAAREPAGADTSCAGGRGEGGNDWGGHGQIGQDHSSNAAH